MKNKIIPYESYLKELAKKLRKESTLSEVLLWQKIKQNKLGVQFHRQVPMLNYIVDFYCHEIQLAIEIDGDSHTNKYKEDINRQQNLEYHGVVFLRFEDIAVKKDMPNVELALSEKIKELLNKTPLKSPQGDNLC